MKIFRLAFVSILTLLIFGGTALAQSTLNWADDEHSIEQDIARYLQEAHGYKLQLKTLSSDPSDEYIVISFNLKGVPDMKFFIDTQPSTKSRNERVIKIYSTFEYDLRQDNPNYCRALEVINKFMDDKWMPQRVYIDPKGDIHLENQLNIVGANNPIPSEMVADILIRNISAWKALFVRLRDADIHRI